jgi:hypothetical protein
VQAVLAAAVGGLADAYTPAAAVTFLACVVCCAAALSVALLAFYTKDGGAYAPGPSDKSGGGGGGSDGHRHGGDGGGAGAVADAAAAAYSQFATHQGHKGDWEAGGSRDAGRPRRSENDSEDREQRSFVVTL